MDGLFGNLNSIYGRCKIYNKFGLFRQFESVSEKNDVKGRKENGEEINLITVGCARLLALKR